jgi:hypothetical protein
LFEPVGELIAMSFILHGAGNYLWSSALRNALRKEDGRNSSVDLSPVYCDGETCYGAREGQPLFFDDNHPSAFANTLIAPMISQLLSERASESPAADAAQNDNAGIPPLP